MKLIILFFFIQSAYGSIIFYQDENFTLKSLESAEKKVIILEGLIRTPMADEFLSLIKQADLTKPLELRFDSVGGSIYETQKIIEILEKLKENRIVLTTRVDQGSMCASSCIPLFVQGQHRIAGNASSFMFHGVAAYIITNIPGAEDTKIMIDSYRKAGINEHWIQEQVDMKVWSSPNETWYNGKELFENGSNFITEILSNRIFFQPYNKAFSNKPR